MDFIFQIAFLEDLGCESSLIIKDTSGQVYNFGSSAGYSFLCQNPEMNIKFRDHFGMYCDTTTIMYVLLYVSFTVCISQISSLGQVCCIFNLFVSHF